MQLQVGCSYLNPASHKALAQVFPCTHQGEQRPKGTGPQTRSTQSPLQAWPCPDPSLLYLPPHRDRGVR